MLREQGSVQSYYGHNWQMCLEPRSLLEAQA